MPMEKVISMRREERPSRASAMENGNIAVDGDPAVLLDSPENPRLREFLQHVH